jgi:hypothetical protein
MLRGQAEHEREHDKRNRALLLPGEDKHPELRAQTHFA